MEDRESKIIKCNLFPKLDDIKNEDTFEIMDKNVTDYTHIIHKYPSKYIPQIPKWAILNFTKEGETVLDPFSGSGTTSVEAIINGRNTVAIDINPVAVLISKVKTTPINPEKLKSTYTKIIENAQNIPDKVSEAIPNIPRIDHWFTEESINNLSKLKYEILKIKDKDIRDFFLVNFSAIIRKTSNAEYRSQKTYVSKRFRKDPPNVFDIFQKRFFQYLKGMEKLYEQYLQQRVTGEIIVGSADSFSLNDFQGLKEVNLAVTSPPYITAVEYPAVFKLEYQWLDYFEDEEINFHRKDYIGTDRCYADQYKKLRNLGYYKLDKQIEEIFNKDMKKSYIVYDYFRRMEKNIEEVYKILKYNGKYVIVVGNNSVMNLEIPLCDYLVNIAEKKGFKRKKVFSYLIKDRHLIIPRNGRGGIIKKDWVIVLEK